MNAAPITKREIERRLAACKASGMEVAGVRFGADGSMTILTASGVGQSPEGDDADAGYERWKRQKAAARRAQGAEAERA